MHTFYSSNGRQPIAMKALLATLPVNTYQVRMGRFGGTTVYTVTQKGEG